MKNEGVQPPESNAIFSLLEEMKELREELKEMRNKVRQLPSTTASRLHPVIELSKISSTPLSAGTFGDGVLNGTDILNIVRFILRKRPRLVVEFGSGQSTIWIGRALELNGYGRLVSFEHADKWYRKTRSELSANMLQNVVDLRCSALTKVEVDSSVYEWYDPETMKDLGTIDLMLVDGPPASGNPGGQKTRFPAVALLRDRISNDGDVLLDDANRPDEKLIVNDWVAKHGMRHLNDQEIDLSTWSIKHMKATNI